MLAFSGRFSRASLEGISFKFFVCFIFNVSLGSAPKRKNFDIQRNTRVCSGGQFTSNRLSNDLTRSTEGYPNEEFACRRPKSSLSHLRIGQKKIPLDPAMWIPQTFLDALFIFFKIIFPSDPKMCISQTSLVHCLPF